MPDELPVHLNRESIHSLEVPDQFEAEGSFDVVLHNHGESVHAHVNLDEALSEVARVEETNHYVEAESDRPVRVVVDGRGTVSGELTVATSYGTTKRTVDVRLVEPDAETDPVIVDESLAEPPTPDDDGGLAGARDALATPLVALPAFAVLVALAAAATVDGPVVLAGSAVVVLGALAAIGLLLTE